MRCWGRGNGCSDDAISFVPTYEERGCKIYEGEDSKDPGIYSLSTYAKPKDVKRFAAMV
jgi:hypothetical protein